MSGPSANQISRSRSGGRDLSWRKPVPRYTPSPPPSSPPSSPAAPPRRVSVSLSSAMNNEIPPLPMDWRETIERALTGDLKPGALAFDSSVSQPSSPRGRQVFNVPPIKVTDVDAIEEMDLSQIPKYSDREPMMMAKVQVNRSRSVSPYFHSYSSSCPRLATYRPPTPPLPSSNKKLRRSDSAMSGFFKPGELMYPDLVGLGEQDSTRVRPMSPDSLTLAQQASVGRPTHHLRFGASWLSLKVGSVDTATTLVDEESPLPIYHSRKRSIESMVVITDTSYTHVVWQLVKGWTELVVSKVKDFGASATLCWKSTLC